MWILKGKPDASMSGNGLLAGLVAITAPSGFVSPTSSAIIGLDRRRAGLHQRCLRRKRAESRRSGRRDLRSRSQWAVGRALRRSVCRRHQQLRWQLERRHWLRNRPVLRRREPARGTTVGISTLLGFVFTFSFALNLVLEFFLGHRVSAESEVAGLDLPEMGQLGYPEFLFAKEPDIFVTSSTGVRGRITRTNGFRQARVKIVLAGFSSNNHTLKRDTTIWQK